MGWLDPDISLDALIEEGWDVADKYEIGSRDNALVPDEDDDDE